MEFLPYLDPDTKPLPFVWYMLATTGDTPECRVGHSCCHIHNKKSISNEEKNSDNGSLYLIGGANPSATLSDCPILNLNSMHWNYKDLTGFVPRYEQSLFYPKADTNKIYIFGGADLTENFNDILVLDNDANKWSKMSVRGEPPSSRTYHTVTSVDDRLVIFSGGSQIATPISGTQVHCFNLTTCTWSTLDIQGDSPKPRLGHVSVTLGNKVYFHGGLAEGIFFDDLHAIDLDKNCWLLLEPVSGVRPSARAAHGAVASGLKYIYMFGGMSKDGALNDFYQLNIDSLTFTQLATNGPAPPPRLDFAMNLIEITLPTMQQSKNCLPSAKASEESKDSNCGEVNSTGKEKKKLCLIHGGMDTEGEVFDDILVICVS